MEYTPGVPRWVFFFRCLFENSGIAFWGAVKSRVSEGRIWGVKKNTPTLQTMIYTRPLQQRGARSEGKKVKVKLNSAKNVLRPRPNDTTEEQLRFRVRPTDTPEERTERLSEGLTDLCEGLICIRKQNGSAVGIALSSVLFNEHRNTQLEKIKRAKV